MFTTDFIFHKKSSAIAGDFNFRSIPILLYGLAIVILGACSPEENDNPEPEKPFVFELPSHFPEPVYDFEKNPISKEGFELGKMLFMDGKLSRDGSISCAHCHITSSAFTQHGHSLAHGIDNRQTMRNSQPIQNLAYLNSFGWDGGIFHLDLFPIFPITNPVEMDEDVPRVLEKLRNDENYPRLFKKVFGTDSIETDHFLKALSQFQLVCISSNSKYDRYLLGQESLSDQEMEGLAIFEEKCSSCHSGVLQTDNSFRNNGLPIGNPRDLGRNLITERDEDLYKFRVPSLRNLKYTFPYMHDGRFFSLESVLDHYSDGVIDSPTLDTLLTGGPSRGISLTESEKSKIINFLSTLNDSTFITNEDIFVF